MIFFSILFIVTTSNQPQTQTMDTMKDLRQSLGRITLSKPQKELRDLHTAKIVYLSGCMSNGFLIQTFIFEKILKGSQPSLVGRNIRMFCNIETNISWGETYAPNGVKYYYQIQVDTKYSHPYLEVYCIAIKYPNGNIYRAYIPDSTKDYSFIR